jgi:hypothetical protein
LRAGRRVGDFMPEIEMGFVGLVPEYFNHVVAGVAKLVEDIDTRRC